MKMNVLKQLCDLFSFSSTTIIDDETASQIFEPQKYSFDCGKACCIMAMRLYDKQLWSPEMTILLNQTACCWTIEMFVALRSLGIDAAMYTNIIGVRETHFKMEWYQKRASDTAAICDAFAVAESRGWIVTEKSLDLNEIHDMLHKGFKAILLVDNNVMKGRLSRPDVYSGHYIFLLGHERDVTYYFDPASSEAEVLEVSHATLCAAHAHQGTDKDVILLPPSSSSVN